MCLIVGCVLLVVDDFVVSIFLNVDVMLVGIDDGIGFIFVEVFSFRLIEVMLCLDV